MHIWELKMQELPGPWTPANIGSLRLPDSTSLRRQNLGKNVWPPSPNPGSATVKFLAFSSPFPGPCFGSQLGIRPSGSSCFCSGHGQRALDLSQPRRDFNCGTKVKACGKYVLQPVTTVWTGPQASDEWSLRNGVEFSSTTSKYRRLITGVRHKNYVEWALRCRGQYF